MDGRPRLVPLPGDDEQEAVNAICPSGHLKIACGGFAKNTAVAIIYVGVRTVFQLSRVVGGCRVSLQKVISRCELPCVGHIQHG